MGLVKNILGAFRAGRDLQNDSANSKEEKLARIKRYREEARHSHTTMSLAKLIKIANHQAIFNGYCVKYYSLLINNTIGYDGLKFQNKARDKEGELLRDINNMFEENFKEFSEKGNCDVTGRHSLRSLLSLWIKQTARDGDCLIRHHFGFDNKFGYAIELISGERLDRNLNAQLNNGNAIQQGIEIDEWGRAVNYYLLARKGRAINGKNYQIIPANEITHEFQYFYAEQRRGWPWTISSQQDFEDLAEYRASEIKSANVNAKRTGFYYQDPDSDQDYDWENSDFELEEYVEAGSFNLLPKGIKADKFDSGNPNPEMANFQKATLRGTSSGLNVNYNRLANDLEGVNFSSLRSGEVDDRDSFRTVQSMAHEGVGTPIAKNLARMSQLTGALPVPAAMMPQYNKPHFNFLPWNWINQKDKALADEIEIRNKTKSRAQKIRESGGDVATVEEEIARERVLYGEINEPS